MKKVFVGLMASAVSYLNAALTDIDILGTSDVLKETKITVTVQHPDGKTAEERTIGFPVGFAEASAAIHSGYLAKWRERRCWDIPDPLSLFSESATTEGQYTLIVNKLHRDLKQSVNFIWGRVNLDMLPEMMAYNILNLCHVFYEEQIPGLENPQNFDDNYEYLENLIVEKVQKLYNKKNNPKVQFINWLKNSFILDFLNSFPALHQKLLHIDPNPHFESPIKGTNQGKDAPTDLLIKLFPLVVGKTLNTNVDIKGNPGRVFSKMTAIEKADFAALWLSSCQILRNELRFFNDLPKELKNKLSINTLIKTVLESSGTKKNAPEIEVIHSNIESALRKTDQKKKENSLGEALSNLFRRINAECEKFIQSQHPNIRKDDYDSIREVNKLVMKSVVYELTAPNMLAGKNKKTKPSLLYPRGTTEMLLFAFCYHVFNGGQDTNGDVPVLLKAMYKRGLIATDHVSLAILHDEAVNKSQEEINKYQEKLNTITQLQSDDKDFVKNTERNHLNLEEEEEELDTERDHSNLEKVLRNKNMCEEMIRWYSSSIPKLNSIDLNNPENFKIFVCVYQDYIDLRIKSTNEMIKVEKGKPSSNERIRELTNKEGVSLEDLLIYYDVKSDVSVPYGGKCIFESNETVAVEYEGKTYGYPDCVETTIRQLMTIFSNYDEKNDKIIPIDGWRDEVKLFFIKDCPKKELVNSKNLTVHNKWAAVCQPVSPPKESWEKNWRGEKEDLCSSWRNIIFMLNYLTQSNAIIPDEVSADEAVQLLQDISVSKNCRNDVVFTFEKEDNKNIRCTLTPKKSTKPESEIKPFKFRIYAGSGHACLKSFDSSSDNSYVTLKIGSDYDIFYGRYLSNTAVEQRNDSYFFDLKFQNKNMEDCCSGWAEYQYDTRIVQYSRMQYDSALERFNRNLFIQSSNLNSTSDSVRQRYFEVLKKEIELNPHYKEKKYNILFSDQASADKNDMETLKIMDTLVLLHQVDESLFEWVKNSHMNKQNQPPDIKMSRQLNFDINNHQYNKTIGNFIQTGFAGPNNIQWDDSNKILGY